MHVLGKVLLWLCVILLIPASLVLSTMVLDVRNRWLNEVADRQQQVEQGIQNIADAQRRVRTLEEERQQLVHSWGDVWNAPNSQVQPGTDGSIELGVGANSGLPHRAEDGTIDPRVYVFAENPDGSQYLGEFVVTDIRPSQSVARLAREPYPQETINWPRGTFHVRGTLPLNWLTTNASLQSQLIIAVANLANQQLQLSIVKDQVKKSQTTLDDRMKELNGDPQAPALAGDQAKDGLVESLRKSETKRNQQLAIVDHLRHTLIDEYVAMQKTLGQCLEKSRILEQRFRERSESQSPETTLTPEAPATLQTADRD